MKKFKTVIAAMMVALCALSAGARVKYIFYFIGDGMGMGHVNATETYNRDVLGNGSPILMMQFPVATQVRTYSFDRSITDSAAAGTALSTGHKTRNGMVGMAPDSTSVCSITTPLLEAGYAIGIASTVAGDDATPGSFYGHAVNRGLSGEISAYAPKSGFSFFGAPVFKGMKGKDGSKTGWVESMKEAGYAVVRSFSSYSALSGDTDKVLMLASNPQGEQVGYTIDSIPGTLTAEEITRTALAQLYKEGKDNGFFLMMEGGNIDWASHANDGATVIREVMNFQKAIDVAYRFYLAHPDETLIVVTADHDTGGMALGRSGTKIPDLSLVDFQRISKDRFSDYCKSLIAGGGEPSWDSMKTFLTENTGLWGAVALTDEETARLRDSFEAAMLSRKSADEKGLYNSFNRFSVDVFDVINSKYGIGWTTGSHTGNPVPLFAVGRDAMLFTKALDNTEIPQLILKAAGIDSFSR